MIVSRQELGKQLEGRSRQWDIVNEFVDTVSGARECRPALDKLLKEAWKGKFQAIVVTRLDRLGRSLSHLIRLLHDLSQQNVALVSLKEQIDLSTSNGRLLFHIFGAIGQFERDLIVERVKRGIAYAKYCGIRVGRPPTIDERVIATALEMKANGASIRTIARTLSISPSGAHKILAKAQLSNALLLSSEEAPDTTTIQHVPSPP